MTTTTTQHDTAAARRAMIDSQLRTSGVNEEFVLARMLAVPREDYLPEDKASLAYIDRSVALGEDAHLAAPLFYGKLLSKAARATSPTCSARWLPASTRPVSLMRQAASLPRAQAIRSSSWTAQSNTCPHKSPK